MNESDEQALMKVLGGLYTPHDYEVRARELTEEGVWSYLSSGAGEGISMRRNREALERREMVPRVLGDTHEASLAIELWGQKYASPFFVAPMASQCLFHQHGEVAMARGASAWNVGMVISMQASLPTSDIVAHCAPKPWLQVQLQRDGGTDEEILAHALTTGCSALVVTVDAPVHCFRDAQLRAGFSLPAHFYRGDLAHCLPQQNDAEIFAGNLVRQAPRWQDIARFCAMSPLPVVLKGILSVEDARCALDHGVRGIVVSNHGGRVMDGVVATMDALPCVVAAVAGRVPVLFDGGIRSGVDVCKARLAGAAAVMIGRPLLHALTVAGAHGVAHCLQLFRRELEAAMILSGVIKW